MAAPWRAGQSGSHFIGHARARVRGWPSVLDVRVGDGTRGAHHGCARYGAGERGRSWSCHRAAAAWPGVRSALGFRARGAHRSWAGGGCLGRVCAGPSEAGEGSRLEAGAGPKEKGGANWARSGKNGRRKELVQEIRKGFFHFWLNTME